MKFTQLFLAALLSVSLSPLAFADGGATPDTVQTQKQKQEKEKPGLKKEHEKKMEARSNKKGGEEVKVDVRVEEKEGNSRQANGKVKREHKSQISQRYGNASAENDYPGSARQPAADETGGTK